MSALYGSEALGGVVNIITKRPSDQWQTTVSGDYSHPTNGKGGGEYMLGLNTSGSLIDDTLSMKLAINKSARTPWKPFTGGRSEVTPLEKRDTLNVSGGLSWQLDEQQTIDFDAIYSKDLRDGIIESSLGANPCRRQC